jgi:hypothetical protein
MRWQKRSASASLQSCSAELFAAVASGHIIATNGGANQRSNVGEHRISGGMTVTVVDALKVVHW